MSPRLFAARRLGRGFKRGNSFDEALHHTSQSLKVLLKAGQNLRDKLSVLGDQSRVDLLHGDSLSSVCENSERTARPDLDPRGASDGGTA